MQTENSRFSNAFDTAIQSEILQHSRSWNIWLIPRTCIHYIMMLGKWMKLRTSWERKVSYFQESEMQNFTRSWNSRNWIKLAILQKVAIDLSKATATPHLLHELCLKKGCIAHFSHQASVLAVKKIQSQFILSSLGRSKNLAPCGSILWIAKCL